MALDRELHASRANFSAAVSKAIEETTGEMPPNYDPKERDPSTSKNNQSTYNNNDDKDILESELGFEDIFYGKKGLRVHR